MFYSYEKKLRIRSKADWYRIEPEHAAWVEELFIASSAGDQFVIGEDDIDIAHSFPRLKHLSGKCSVKMSGVTLPSCHFAR